MESIVEKNIIFIHLYPNENVLESLCELSENHNIQTGFIISGIGQLKNITLGFFKEKDDYQEQKFSEPFELLSLSGSIIKQDNSYLPHIHCTVGDIEKQVFGGHLIDATVEITNEIVLLITNLSIQRKKSNKTGLMELSFQS